MAASEELDAEITPIEQMTNEHKELIGNWTTVPQIIINDEYIGGYDDLVADNIIRNKDDRCLKRNKDNKYSCFSNNEIKEIVDAYNSHFPKKRITTRDTRAMYKQLEARVRICSGEKCWIEQSFAKNIRKKLMAAFVPDMPKEWRTNPNAWLTNQDIQNVMGRYAKTNPSFDFLGVYSMDFRHKKRGACISNLCGFDIANHPKKSKIAAVFNLDNHDQSGSHWVTLMVFANPKDPRYGVFYYDSVGKPPTPEIDEFSTEICEQLDEKTGSPPGYNYNSMQNQHQNTECGMFCIYFIYRCLTTRLSINTVCRTMGDDRKMLNQRREFFKP